MELLSVNGTLVLFFANMFSKVFGAFYRLPLSNMLGAEGIGLYQMAFPVYSFLLSFITGGVSVHLTRVLAKYRANDNSVAIYKEFVIARNISLIAGFIFLAFLLIFAYPISFLQGNVSATFGYIAIAFGFIFAVMLGAYRGYYQGFSNMKPTAISQLLEQVSKLLFGLLFAWFFMHFGISSGVFGALLGISFSELISFVYFAFLNKKHIKKENIIILKTDYKQFIKQVIPISVSYMMLPLSALIDSFIVVNLLTLSGFTSSFATSLYGIQTGMILPLINLPNILVSAIALANIPEISYKVSKSDVITNNIGNIFKTVFIFILPCCVGMYMLATPIISNIFVTLSPRLLQIAVNLLKISTIEMFFLCFITITNSILQALNEIKLPAVTMAIGMFTKLILSVFFISNYNLNILGLVIASIFGYFVTAVINIIFIKKRTKLRLKLNEIMAPVCSVLFMILFILFIFLTYGAKLKIIQLFSTICISAIIYFLSLIFFKQISFKDIKKVLQIRHN